MYDSVHNSKHARAVSVHGITYDITFSIFQRENIPGERKRLTKPIWQYGEAGLVYMTCPASRCRAIMQAKTSEFDVNGRIIIEYMGCVVCTRCQGHVWPILRGWKGADKKTKKHEKQHSR